tara:strand:- start:368 stop:589 length:222 start_codon:yes stop_codon:yes gene_type:complete
MADRKIYITHDYQTAANVKGLKLENNLPSASAGGVAFDGKFKVSESSSWDEVTTANNTQTLDNKTISGGLFTT